MTADRADWGLWGPFVVGGLLGDQERLAQLKQFEGEEVLAVATWRVLVNPPVQASLAAVPALEVWQGPLEGQGVSADRRQSVQRGSVVK